jgi:phosphoribosylformylglycinamidine synthase
MASESFCKEIKTKRVNVQIGDPFTEKLLMEACLELVEKKCIVGIQDMGAAGLTSSIFELAMKSRKGLTINLDRVPLREEGMNPYEIMLSESQERMLVVAIDSKIEEIKEIFEKWDLSMEIIGEVVGGGNVTIKWFNEVAADIPVKELDDFSPVYERTFSKPEKIECKKKQAIIDRNIHNHNDVLKTLLANTNIASKRWVYEQYDHMVRTNTVILPGSDASVIRVKGFKKGIAISSDGNGKLCYINPYFGAKHAVCEALINIACAGATPLGITNCLNFGNPENPTIMWQFVNVIDGMKDACSMLGVPIVSGNVSFYNETEGINIYPTPVIVAVGSIEEINNVKNSFYKVGNNKIVLLGLNSNELGGSIYADKYIASSNIEISDVNLIYTKKLLILLAELVKHNLIESAHDVSDGGLAVAIAEMTLGNKIGADIMFNENLEESFIYSEEKPRIIIEIKDENIKEFFKRCEKADINVQIIGTTNSKGMLKISNKDKVLVNVDINTICDIYNNAFKKWLK